MRNFQLTVIAILLLTACNKTDKHKGIDEKQGVVQFSINGNPMVQYDQTPYLRAGTTDFFWISTGHKVGGHVWSLGIGTLPLHPATRPLQLIHHISPDTARGMLAVYYDVDQTVAEYDVLESETNTATVDSYDEKTKRATGTFALTLYKSYSYPNLPAMDLPDTMRISNGTFDVVVLTEP